MRRSLSFFIVIVSLVVSPVSWARDAGSGISSHLFLFDAELFDTLERNPETLAALQEKAQRALSSPLYSVVDKKSTPASGDRQDYYSLGPYWWPNPDTENGLPYVRRDGKRNPEINQLAGDNHRLVALSRDVTALALAYRATGDTRYADKARAQLRNWFIRPDTRMNPNFQHAQAIPGLNDGRGIGIIEARFFIPLIDAVELLGAQLSTEETQFIQQWFRQFNHWLQTSDNGFEEDNWHNNHGTWFDAQVVAFALFTGDRATAERRLRITQMRRIGAQFDRHGNQHAEFERTRPWHYANFNLEAYNLLGRFGEKVGVDIWNYSVDGHALKKGYALIAETVLQPENWPYKEMYGLDLKVARSTLYHAQRAYPDTLFAQAWAKLADLSTEGADPRLVPVK
ncbi:alginate lyase family protein [Microbulbifer elongatus]|uniref:Alginate lyase family protein n=1 Tax=Microbulbifer elongatus TaxID=86173 RepID=A0ABT1NXT0_9GAMM|nr:alginate lyase family protein [Microbulbifer elongatus]MCQ3828622.1 alginate lyase family protein [Microbulbifer elongatus]